VGAVVQDRQLPPHRLVVTVQLHAGAAHLVHRGVVDLDAAHPVEQHVDLDPGARAFGQRIGEFLADRAGPVDIGFEIDRLLGFADRLQHGGKDLVAVQQDVDLVAFDDRRPQQHAERAPELGIVGAVLARQLGVDLLFVRHEVQHQQACQQGGHDGN
jgi:hypothetical protein